MTPPMIAAVPSPMSRFNDSSVRNTASVAANRGEVDITIVAFDAPMSLIAVKFINLPPGKLMAPARRNHKNVPAVNANISGVWKMKAAVIVIIAEEATETSVALVEPIFCIPDLARTAAVPNPRAAPKDKIIPGINKLPQNQGYLKFLFLSLSNITGWSPNICDNNIENTAQMANL